ncbi:MAG TPA: hypothetical protein VGL13_08220 [Polyangiaceae bacterium]|jgi:hypothetical protein
MAWLQRAPFPQGTEVEVREVYEANDFETVVSREIIEAEERLRRKIGGKPRSVTSTIERRAVQ